MKKIMALLIIISMVGNTVFAEEAKAKAAYVVNNVAVDYPSAFEKSNQASKSLSKLTVFELSGIGFFRGSAIKLTSYSTFFDTTVSD